MWSFARLGRMVGGIADRAGWNIQSGKFGFRLVDHEGMVGLSGKEDEVREKYAEFCDWYETSLLPAILNERVS